MSGVPGLNRLLGHLVVIGDFIEQLGMIERVSQLDANTIFIGLPLNIALFGNESLRKIGRASCRERV